MESQRILELPDSGNCSKNITVAADQYGKDAHLTVAHDVPQGDAITDANRGDMFGPSDRVQLIEMKAMLTQIQATSKPILSIEEAAELIAVSPKRMNNIIYQEKKRLGGRLPDFVCDAGGVLSKRIIRDQLIGWVQNRKRVRQSKNATGGIRS